MNITTEIKNLVFKAICAFANENGIADFSLDNLSEVGISKDALSKIIKELHNDSTLEDMTAPGFFKRVILPEIEECPDFLFNPNLTLPQKLFLLECKDKLSDYSKIKPIQLAIILGDSSREKSIQGHLFRIKRNTTKTLFEILQNTQSIKKRPYHVKYKLIECPNGFQIDSEERASEYRGLVKIDRDIRKRELDNIEMGKLLMKKITSSKYRRLGALEVSVDIEYLQALYNSQEGKDYYTGVELTKDNISVDRINNDLGYIEGNLILTTTEINMLRKNTDINRFLEICNLIAQKHSV